MTGEACTDEGGDPKGKRVAAAAFIEEQVLQLLDFLEYNRAVPFL